MNRRRRVPLAPVAIVALAAASCGDGRDIVVGDDYEIVLDPLPASITKVDVLVVVDDSGSIAAERAAMIAAAGESLFAQLTDDLGQLPDLHVAVVSTDVTIELANVPGCASGADGRFRTGNGTVTCPVQGAYIIDSPDGAGGRTTNYDGAIADAFSCFATLDVSGCGFEQPLEAMRRALDGRYPEHAGFLRQDALLVVVMLTDEDDCSAFDPNLFGDPSAGIDSPLGPRTSFRCFEFGVVCDPDQPRAHGVKTACVPREDSAYVTPVSEYRQFLDGLKLEPGLVMVAGLMGPSDVIEVGPDVLSPELPALVPACFQPDTDFGTTPPIRLTALGESFPSRFVFENLCEATTAGERLRRVTRATTGVMSRRPCLLGKVGPSTTTERCRAYDVIGTTRAPVEPCRGAGTSCFVVEPSAQCDYTPSGLAATYRGQLAAGHRLVVECLPDSD
ncbi:MAG: hypothetical protein K8M05_17885 [Deltaproteobacteria bacterium]|nr:hypothetical protein [Kofleriaceae bacterium]